MDDEKSPSASGRALPLEKTRFKFEGKEISALDPRWCDNSHAFPRCYFLTHESKVHVKPWVTNTELIIETCKWLLQLPYHKFWSQIIYGDRQFRVMVDSFFEYCPRWYDRDKMKRSFFSRNSKVRNLSGALYESMFFVILRMGTSKEATKCSYMSTEFHGKLILEHHLFDIPRLMDLCSIYSTANRALVHRMLEILFKSQPKLLDQLKEHSNIIINILAKIEFDIERLVGRKVKILSKIAGRQDERIAGDILKSLIDLIHPICLFTKLCPKALEYYHEAGLTSVIPKFVEQTIGDMLQDLYDRDLKGGFRLKLNEQIGRLGSIRMELVALWRNLLQYNILDKMQNSKVDAKGDTESASYIVDRMLDCLSDCLNEKTFLRLYASKYPLSNDIDNWSTQRIELDMGRVQYISDAITAALELDANQGVANALNAQTNSDFQPTLDPSLIGQFCELFPDYNPIEAESIINYYNGDAEAAINNILSGGLPVRWLPPGCSLLPLPEEEPIAAASVTPIATSSADQNQFGDLVPLRESSKRGAKNFVEDKATVNSLKPFYESFQNETEENEWETLVGVQSLNTPLPRTNNVFDIDDDEYDDTYDAQDVDLNADMTADETAAHRNQMAGQNKGMQRGDSDNRYPSATGGTGGGAGYSQGAGASSRPYRGGYTGGRDRQEKERRAQHNRKDLAMKKQSKGFGFY